MMEEDASSSPEVSASASAPASASATNPISEDELVICPPASAAAASTSAGGCDADEHVEDDSDSSDDDSFKSATCSLAESLLECSSTALFRSAHSTFADGTASVGGGGGSSLMWRGSAHSAHSPLRTSVEGLGSGGSSNGEAPELSHGMSNDEGTAAASASASGCTPDGEPTMSPPEIQRVTNHTHAHMNTHPTPPCNNAAGQKQPHSRTSGPNVGSSPHNKAAAADAANATTDDASDTSDTGPWRVITSHTETERPALHSVSINQDVTCVALGTSKGYRIRTIAPVPLVPPVSNERLDDKRDDGVGVGVERQQQPPPNKVMVHQSAIANGGAIHCQMLYGTSLLGVVRTSAPRAVSMTNATTGASLRDLHFVTPVQRVEMNRQLLVVLTADGRLHVFKLGTLDVVRSVSVLHPSEPLRSITGFNATTAGAFFALSNCDDEPFLACRSGDALGEIKIFNAAAATADDDDDDMRLDLVGTIRAHSHPIARMAIGGRKGEQRLATASQKGTVIRVWSLPQRAKLFVLLRGSNPCQTFSVAFNEYGTRLVSSSSSGTVHVFKLSTVGQHGGSDGSAGGGGGYGQLVRTSLAGRLSVPRLSFFLPESVSDQTDGIRSYAKIKMRPERVGGGGGGGAAAPVQHQHTYVAFLKSSNRFEDNVLVCTHHRGSLYRFCVDAKGHSRTVASEDMLFDDEHVVYNSL